MSPADEQRVGQVFRRESRALLQYARGASLYAAGADRKLRDAVLRIASEEAAAIETFGRFLEARRILYPHLGAFPVAFTDLNFVAVRHLLPRIIAEQKADLSALEADAAALTDPAARAEVGTLADVHRRHLGELEQLGG